VSDQRENAEQRRKADGAGDEQRLVFHVPPLRKWILAH
jgi:hypothetical protein